jgi:hypothetical protein
VDVVAVGPSGSAETTVDVDPARITGQVPDGVGVVTTRVVAENALVLAGPVATGPDFGADGGTGFGRTSASSPAAGDASDELLVLAVGRSTAIDLAGAGLGSALSVVLRATG